MLKLPEALVSVIKDALVEYDNTPALKGSVENIELGKRLVGDIVSRSDLVAAYDWVQKNDLVFSSNPSESYHDAGKLLSSRLVGGSAGAAWLRENIQRFADEVPLTSLLTAPRESVYEAFQLNGWRIVYGLDALAAARFAWQYTQATGTGLDLEEAFGDGAEAVARNLPRFIPEGEENPAAWLAVKLASTRDGDVREALLEDMGQLDEALTLSPTTWTTIPPVQAAKLLWAMYVGYFVLAVEAPELAAKVNKSTLRPPALDKKPGPFQNYNDVTWTYLQYFHPHGSRYKDPSAVKEFKSLPEDMDKIIHRAWLGQSLTRATTLPVLGMARRWLAEHKMAGSMFHVFNASWRKGDWQLILDNIPVESVVYGPFKEFADKNVLPKEGLVLQKTLSDTGLTKSMELNVNGYDKDAQHDVSSTPAGKWAQEQGTPIGVYSELDVEGNPRVILSVYSDYAGDKWFVFGAPHDLEKFSVVSSAKLYNMLKAGSAKVVKAVYDKPGSSYATKSAPTLPVPSGPPVVAAAPPAPTKPSPGGSESSQGESEDALLGVVKKALKVKELNLIGAGQLSEYFEILSGGEKLVGTSLGNYGTVVSDSRWKKGGGGVCVLVVKDGDVLVPHIYGGGDGFWLLIRTIVMAKWPDSIVPGVGCSSKVLEQYLVAMTPTKNPVHWRIVKPMSDGDIDAVASKLAARGLSAKDFKSTATRHIVFSTTGGENYVYPVGQNADGVYHWVLTDNGVSNNQIALSTEALESIIDAVDLDKVVWPKAVNLEPPVSLPVGMAWYNPSKGDKVPLVVVDTNAKGGVMVTPAMGHTLIISDSVSVTGVPVTVVKYKENPTVGGLSSMLTSVAACRDFALSVLAASSVQPIPAEKDPYAAIQNKPLSAGSTTAYYLFSFPPYGPDSATAAFAVPHGSTFIINLLADVTAKVLLDKALALASTPTVDPNTKPAKADPGAEKKYKYAGMFGTDKLFRLPAEDMVDYFLKNGPKPSVFLDRPDVSGASLYAFAGSMVMFDKKKRRLSAYLVEEGTNDLYAILRDESGAYSSILIRKNGAVFTNPHEFMLIPEFPAGVVPVPNGNVMASYLSDKPDATVMGTVFVGGAPMGYDVLYPTNPKSTGMWTAESSKGLLAAKSYTIIPSPSPGSLDVDRNDPSKGKFALSAGCVPFFQDDDNACYFVMRAVAGESKITYAKGRLDAGEETSQAAARECVEELGLSVKPVKFLMWATGAQTKTAFYFGLVDLYAMPQIQPELETSAVVYVRLAFSGGAWTIADPAMDKYIKSNKRDAEVMAAALAYLGSYKASDQANTNPMQAPSAPANAVLPGPSPSLPGGPVAPPPSPAINYKSPLYKLPLPLSEGLVSKVAATVSAEVAALPGPVVPLSAKATLSTVDTKSKVMVGTMKGVIIARIAYEVVYTVSGANNGTHVSDWIYVLLPDTEVFVIVKAQEVNLTLGGKAPVAIHSDAPNNLHYTHKDAKVQALLEVLSVNATGYPDPEGFSGAMKGAGVTVTDFKKWCGQAGVPNWAIINTGIAPYVASLFHMGGVKQFWWDQVHEMLSMHAKATKVPGGKSGVVKSKSVTLSQPAVSFQGLSTPGVIPLNVHTMFSDVAAQVVADPYSVSYSQVPQPKGLASSSNPSMFIQSPDGTKFVLKGGKNNTEVRVAGESAAYRLMTLVSNRVVPVVEVETSKIQGVGASAVSKTVATLQPFVPGAAPAGSGLSDLSADDVVLVLRQHVLDMYIGDHDAGWENWVRAADGKLVPIDRGMAFKFLMQKSPNAFNLDPIKPVPGIANSKPIAKQILTAWATDPNYLIPDDAFAAMREMCLAIEQAMTEPVLQAVLGKYAQIYNDQLGGFSSKDEAVSHLVGRLLDERTKLYDNWKDQLEKLAKKGGKTFPWPPATHTVNPLLRPGASAKAKALADAKLPYTEVHKAMIEQAEASGWAGVSVPADKGALENQSVNVHCVKVGSGLGTLVRWRINAHAAQALAPVLSTVDQNTKVAVTNTAGVVSSFNPAQGGVYPFDNVWSIISLAVKTVNFYLKSDNIKKPFTGFGFNMQKVNAAEALLAPGAFLSNMTDLVNAEKAKTGDVNPQFVYQGILVDASGVMGMVDKYTMYINIVSQTVKDANAQGMSYKHAGYTGGKDVFVVGEPDAQGGIKLMTQYEAPPVKVKNAKAPGVPVKGTSPLEQAWLDKGYHVALVHGAAYFPNVSGTTRVVNGKEVGYQAVAINAVPHPVTGSRVATQAHNQLAGLGHMSTDSVVISAPGGVEIHFVLPSSLSKSSTPGFRGHAWGFIPEAPSAQSVSRVLKVFQDATKLSMNPPGVDDERAMYLLRQAFCLQSVGDPNAAASSSTPGVSKASGGDYGAAGIVSSEYKAALNAYTAGDTSKAISLATAFVSKATGLTPKQIEAEMASGSPKFVAGLGSTGNRVPLRLGWNRNRLVKELGSNAYVCHTLFGNSSSLDFLKVALKLNGALIGNSSKPFLGVGNGASTSDDYNAGGDSCVFTCLYRGSVSGMNSSKTGILLDISLLLRTDAYIVGWGGDGFGNMMNRTRCTALETVAMLALCEDIAGGKVKASGVKDGIAQVMSYLPKSQHGTLVQLSPTNIKSYAELASGSEPEQRLLAKTIYGNYGASDLFKSSAPGKGSSSQLVVLQGIDLTRYLAYVPISKSQSSGRDDLIALLKNRFGNGFKFGGIRAPEDVLVLV